MENLEIYDNVKEKKYDLIKESPKITGYASVDKPWLKFHSEEAKNAIMPDMSMYDYLYERNKDNLDEIAISGHIEGKRFLPWQMFDKSRYTKR